MTRYITLAEYFWLAEQVTSADAGTLAKDARSDLADSALHAPQAGFGDTEFHPDVIDKAAVPVCRLARWPVQKNKLRQYSFLNGPNGLNRKRANLMK